MVGGSGVVVDIDIYLFICIGLKIIVNWSFCSDCIEFCLCVEIFVVWDYFMDKIIVVVFVFFLIVKNFICFVYIVVSVLWG